MKTMIAIAGLLLLLSAGSANAALVSYDFTGNNEWNTHQTLTGHFSYDSITGAAAWNVDLTGTHYEWNNVTAFISSGDLFVGAFGTLASPNNAYIEFTLKNGGQFSSLPTTLNLADFSMSMPYWEVGNVGDPNYYQYGVMNMATLTPSTATPIPAAAWLLGSGLLGLVGIRRRKV